jgi:hypothetical protein
VAMEIDRMKRLPYLGDNGRAHADQGAQPNGAKDHGEESQQSDKKSINL